MTQGRDSPGNILETNAYIFIFFQSSSSFVPPRVSREITRENFYASCEDLHIKAKYDRRRRRKALFLFFYGVVEIQTGSTRSSHVLNPRSITLVTCSVRWYESRIQKYFSPLFPPLVARVHHEHRLSSLSPLSPGAFASVLTFPSCSCYSTSNTRLGTPPRGTFVRDDWVRRRRKKKKERKKERNGEKVGRALGGTRTRYLHRKQCISKGRTTSVCFRATIQSVFTPPPPLLSTPVARRVILARNSWRL